MSFFARKLKVRWRGPFVFLLPKSAEGMVEVYAPSCGHVYGFSINHNHSPEELDFREVQQLNPKSYVLQISGKHSPTKVPPIPEKNLRFSNRNVKDGWDLRIILPVPCDIESEHPIPITQTTDKRELEGRDASQAIDHQQIWLDQIFSYKDVKHFDLCGSATCNLELGKDTELLITAEMPFVPTLEHQRMTVDSLAHVLGLDMRLIRPTVGRPHLEDMSGNCMGGAYGGNP